MSKHWQGSNSFLHRPVFLRVCSTTILKTLWEKEKFLRKSNFTFSHSVLYPLVELYSIFVIFIHFNLKLLSANSFSLEDSQIFHLGNEIILELSKLKAFKANNLKVYQKLKFFLERVENLVGKGENAGHQHFLLFPQCFQSASSLGLLQVGIVW